MGAPRGNNNAVKSRDWADALRRLTSRPVDDPENPGKTRKRIEAIAEKLIKLAEEGDMQALKEIGDRIDGKSMQSVELAGEGGGPIITKTLQVAGVDPTDKDTD